MNHLNEIRLNSNVVGQNFTPGNQNPADFCARYSILKDSKRWFYGPEQSNQFIKPGESKINIDDIDLEYSYLENTVQNLAENCQKITFRQEHYSSYAKLLRHVAWFIKIIKNGYTLNKNKCAQNVHKFHQRI